LPALAARAIDADLIAYIPAGQPPHKRGHAMTPAHHRLAMLRLAVADIPNAVVLTDELDRAADGRPSYTVDTLEALHERLGPDVTLRLLFGADMLRIFSKWHKPSRIVELAEPLVMVRPPDTRASLLASLPEADRATWEHRLVDVPAMDVSSTAIREKLRNGEPTDGMLAPAVRAYAERHQLYK
jgi:nicotinate-nucleotide adenylyltransferase